MGLPTLPASLHLFRTRALIAYSMTVVRTFPDLETSGIYAKHASGTHLLSNEERVPASCRGVYHQLFATHTLSASPPTRPGLQKFAKVDCTTRYRSFKTLKEFQADSTVLLRQSTEYGLFTPSIYYYLTKFEFEPQKCRHQSVFFGGRD